MPWWIWLVLVLFMLTMLVGGGAYDASVSQLVPSMDCSTRNTPPENENPWIQKETDSGGAAKRTEMKSPVPSSLAAPSPKPSNPGR